MIHLGLIHKKIKPMMHFLRISNKFESVTALKQWPNQTYMSQKAELQIISSASLVGIFPSNRHQFHTSILLSNWILNKHPTSIWNLGSDAYFEYWLFMLFQSSDTFQGICSEFDFHIYYLFVVHFYLKYPLSSVDFLRFLSCM
jgi:hypothetical protein